MIDCVIVGGGPAGLAASAALTRRQPARSAKVSASSGWPLDWAGMCWTPTTGRFARGP